MIPGLHGHLLPSAFLLEHLQSAAAPPDSRFQQRLRRICHHARQLGPASSLRAIVDVAASPLLDLLGLVPAEPVRFHRDYATIRCRAKPAAVVMLVTAWGTHLDAFWRHGVVEALEASAAWCLLFNGTQVRIFPAARVHSRRSIEIELDAAADEALTAAALDMLLDSRALAGEGDTCLSALIAKADDFAAGVCRSLRVGVLDASREVLRALALHDRRRSVDDVFEQSLTIVYRVLFLLFAEARRLVPLWHPVYRHSYSIDALRDAALKGDEAGLWDAMRAASRLAHAGCTAGDLEVTAFNGRLFSPSRTPLAERRGLDDRAARRAIIALSTRSAGDGEGRERISYRDLGVEQLGAVYETLLDYVPRIQRDGRGRPRAVALETGSGVRKDTGTFYTPQAIVDHLVRDALSPLVADRTPEQILALAVVDPAMGSGAFLVSACRYLARAYERSLTANGHCHPTDIGAAERASIRRLVAERCLFGVDINPTAVQLARLSIWLTTLAADKPLTFLDHRLRVGDSLAGTWLSLLRSAPTPKRAARDLPLFDDEVTAAAMRQALPVRFKLAAEPNDTAAQVRDKERALADLLEADSPLGKWTRIANAWCAAWLANPRIPSSAFGALAEAILTGRATLPGRLQRDLLDRVQATATERRLFHWELEYPEVFFDASGARRTDAGFDAVIGNPPWDMVRGDSHGDREAARIEASALVRFARGSGVYTTRSDGHVNRYQLFLDRAIALTRPGGRIGLVLPSGVLTDAGSAAVRRLLFSRCAVERIVGFDNRRATFPIHRSVRFVLLAGRVGALTAEVACRFGEVDTSALDRAVAPDDSPDPSWYPVRITPGLVERISGGDLSIPELRTPRDLRIAERAAGLFSPLGSPAGWHAQFGRELNVSDDRSVLRSDGSGLPVLEGKSIEPFRVLGAPPRWHILEEDAVRVAGRAVQRARLAYRDVAAATNKVTLIAAILPSKTASTHTLFCLKTPLSLRQQHLLCALLNSLAVNFLVRQRVNTHVTTTIVERLPIPREEEIGPWALELVAAAQRLSASDDRALVTRLNAIVARLYALDDEDFSHVLTSFPLIPADHRAAMLEAFRRL